MRNPIAAAVAAAFLPLVPIEGLHAVEEITVSAAPLGTVLQPAQALDREALLLRRAPSIGETLANELGIHSSYFGPASARPIIRGLGGSRVTVLNAGISTLDVADVSADHAVTVEPLLAERIEVIRGPATLFYGSSAAGGVVNVIDRRVPEDLPEAPVTGAVEARGDTATGEQAVVGRLDGRAGAIAWHIDGFTRETDDVDIADFATADPAARPADQRRGRLKNSFSESDGFAGGASWIGERGFVGIGISRLENLYGLPGPKEEEDEEEEGPAIADGPFLDMQQTRVDLRGEYRPDGWLRSVRAAFGSNDYEHTEFEPNGEVGTRFENEAWQARIEAVHATLAGFDGAVGLQIDQRDFSALGEEAFVEPVETTGVGVFLTERRSLGAGRLELGLRVEDLEHEASLNPVDYAETAVSVAAGLAFPLAGALEASVNLSRNERNPAAEELYSNGPHLATQQFEIGLLAEPGGRAEKEVSVNFDLGLGLQGERISWSIAAFYNDIGDYVFEDLSSGEIEDGLPVARWRQQDATLWGAEAELVVAAPELAGGIRPRLRLFADFVEAELDGGGRLPRIPPLRAGARLSAERAGWTAGLDVTWHAEQDEVSSFATDSFTLVGIDVVYRTVAGPAALEFFARGSNLLDEDARRSTSFLAAFAPLPGAALTAGIAARF